MDLPDESFQNALLRFQTSLTKKQRDEFQACSLQDVKITIKELETSLAAQRKQRNMRKMAKFVEGMSQLAQVVELFLNVDATVAFVWAPIKFLLLAAGTWVETLDCLLDTYKEIGDVLPGLAQYKNLVPKHPFIKVHLENYYCTVLELHRKALDVFSRPNWKIAFHSSWRTFKTQFGGTVKDLKKYRDLISDEKITATILEVQELGQSMEERMDELSRQLEHLRVDVDQSFAMRHREQLDKKRQFVLSKLDPPAFEDDFERASKERRGTPSGSWILDNATFQDWADVTCSKHRTLYMNGSPGTGKTIFASWVIEHLKKLQATSQETGRDISLVYFFFKHSQPNKRTLTAFLLSAICQLLFQDEVLLDIIYQRCLSVDQQKVHSELLLRELAAIAVASQRLCYLVIDGLDECLGDSTINSKEAQEELIDWVESMASEGDAEGSEAADRSIRLLVCAQRNGTIEKRLALYPSIQLELVDAHLRDVERYAELKSFLIQQKFTKKNFVIDEEGRKDIVKRVCSGAKGMFLYAKIVLGNFLNLVSVAHFKRELKTENFPKGLDQAYERVVICILENPIGEEREAAKRILGLVLSAERPLMWKEIQSHFCIDIDDETADPDFRLQGFCKDFCGSLVEVEHNIKSLSGADSIVHLVHETARGYLLHTRRFSFEHEDAKTALFCARYLSSNAFLRAEEQSEVKEYFVTGYYGLMDYAAANWWKHAGRLLKSTSQNEAVVSTLLQTLHKIQATNAAQDQPREAEDELTADEVASLRTKVHQLPSHGREWEDAFPVESRIRRIRANIESLYADRDVAELDDVQELYGSLIFKCPKPWCDFFLHGFETGEKRNSHLGEHERPFRCVLEGCYGSQIGFSNESDLAKHNSRLHRGEAPLDYFPSLAIQLSKANRMDLFKAAAKGDLARVKEFVATGGDVNSQTTDGLTPLHLAASKGYLEVCRYLLDRGACIDAQGRKSKKTALHMAVSNNDAELAHLLISKHGASTSIRDRLGQTAVGLAENRDCKTVMATFPAASLAHKFCRGLNCEVAARQVKNKLGKLTTVSNPFVAIQYGAADLVKYMVHNGCIDLHYEFERTGTSALNQALFHNNTDVAEGFLRSGWLQHLNKFDKTGKLPLHYACQYSSSESVIGELVSKTLNIDAKDRDGNNIIHFLLTNNKLTGSQEQKDVQISLISTILGFGKVDINEHNNDDDLPLHVACRQGNLAAVNLLLNQTCSIDERNSEGYTPVHLAVLGKYWDIVSVLLIQAGPVNLLNKGIEGTSILAGISRWEIRSNLAMMDRLFWDNPSIDFSHTGLTALHWAAWSLNPAMVLDEVAKGNAIDINSSAVELPPEWDQELRFSTLAISNSAAKRVLLTPLFLAMNVRTGNILGSASRTETLNTILAVPGLDISKTFDMLPEEYHVIPTRHFLDLGLEHVFLWEKLIQVGLTLPWKLMSCDEKSGTIEVYMAGPPTDKPMRLFIPLTLIYKCNFLGIAKSNFPLAHKIVCHLSKNKTELTKLNFGGAEDGVELLTEIHRNQSPSTLEAMIEAGFDCYNTLLNAVYVNRLELVELLLQTGMLNAEDQGHVTDETGAAAYDIALRDGHLEIAQLLMSQEFYGSEDFLEHIPTGLRTETSMGMEEYNAEQPDNHPGYLH
ncbi:Ankyrin repeat-containing domain protein [Rhypophila decipiens]